ncbi:minor tail protein [Gordonia phage Anon]|nr:minor tail protein [Gordonia phage Anon]
MSGIASREASDNLYKLIQQRRAKAEMIRLAPARIRLWDGDMTLRGEVAGERGGDFEFVENGVGTAKLELSLDHYLAKWVMNFRGRRKRNVHVSFDKSGARWVGRMDHYKVIKTKDGDRYLEISFKHDMAELDHILVWANPWLVPELQFPKLWVVFGPAKWCLLLTLFAQIIRLETSIWTFPDNPLDPSEWFPLSFNPASWRNIVKPFSFWSDNTPTTVVYGRFKPFSQCAKQALEDNQLTMTCRRYFHGEDPHPFEGMQGLFGLDPVEDLFQRIPLRHGCLVWDVVDNSGWATPSSFGGSLLTGLIRAIVRIASDGTTEGVDVFTGDPEFPGDYYKPGFKGTHALYPHVVFEEGPLTGIESSEFTYYEATVTSFVHGSQSAAGVNEAISAAINIGGDALTSFINSTFAIGGAFGLAIDLPPLGGLLDSLAAPIYTDVFLAYQQVGTLRAADLSLPIPGLENLVSGLGDFHYYEDMTEGTAHSLGAHLEIRKRIHETRDHTEHTLKVSDAAPYLIGEKGFGDLWLGNRVCTSVLGYPVPDQLFVERVQRIKYSWDKDGPSGWELAIGYKKPKDPTLSLFDEIAKYGEVASGTGIF